MFPLCETLVFHEELLTVQQHSLEASLGAEHQRNRLAGRQKAETIL